jgi:hypothetical protein
VCHINHHRYPHACCAIVASPHQSLCSFRLQRESRQQRPREHQHHSYRKSGPRGRGRDRDPLRGRRLQRDQASYPTYRQRYFSRRHDQTWNCCPSQRHRNLHHEHAGQRHPQPNRQLCRKYRRRCQHLGRGTPRRRRSVAHPHQPCSHGYPEPRCRRGGCHAQGHYFFSRRRPFRQH